MTDYPDIYADGIAVSSGTFGVTVTLQLSDPDPTAGAYSEAGHTVGRIRMGAALARVLGQALLDAASQTPPQAPQTTKH